MATTIKLKNGSGAPLAGDLVQGEPALDLTNKRLYTEDSGGTVIEVGTNPTSLTTGTFTSTGIDDNATSTAITIDSSENVGIGTNSPVSALTLPNDGQISWASTACNIQATSSGADYIKFTTNSNEAMRIDSSGKVGIGTTAPAQLLDVSGTAIFGGSTTRLTTYSDSTYSGIFNGSALTSDEAVYMGGDSIFFYGGGTERMRIDSSGNVGIGTTTTSNARATIASAGVNGADEIALAVDHGDLSLATNQEILMRFGQAGGSNSLAQIGAAYTGGTFDGALLFKTNSSGTVTERMRIDSSGRVFIGKTSDNDNTAGHTLHSSGLVVHTRDSAFAAIFNRTTDDGDIAQFKKDGATVGSIGSASIGGLEITGNNSGRSLLLSTNFFPANGSGAKSDGVIDLGLSDARWNDLYLSGGAYLGGTAAANQLDDYEEGTWTPTITDATNNATMGASNFGRYTKIGRLVVCQMYVETTSLGSIAAPAATYVSGWPFSIGSTGGAVASQASGLAIGADQSLTLSPWSSTLMRLAKWDATTGTSNLVASEWSADGAMYITISYEV